LTRLNFCSKFPTGMERKSINEARRIVFSPSKLRLAREAAYPDLSLRGFAREMGITPQRLSAYETGIDNPSPTMLAQLCFLLDTDLLALIEKG
jgi:transcriptional regulator with XRE-family HTH domain